MKKPLVLIALVLTFCGQQTHAQDPFCNSRCTTIESACAEPYVTECRAEGTAALRRCEEAGGSSATCQASYDNTYKECMSRNGPSINACLERQGCKKCFSRCGLFYCNCGALCYDGGGEEECGLEFDGGYSNPCECNPDDPNCVSPIVIDVENNGYSLTGVLTGVRFDIKATGKPIQTAWTEANSDDAWLVLDRNANGLIDDATELFGDRTAQPEVAKKNGFLALAVFDANGDGLIDSKDSVYAKLRLWRDTNHDGISQPSELSTLSALGVPELSLTYTETRRRDRYGNLFRYRSKQGWDVFLIHER